MAQQQVEDEKKNDHHSQQKSVVYVDGSLNDKELEELSQALSQNSSSIIHRFEFRGLTSKNIHRVCHAIPCWSDIQELDLSQNPKMGPRGCQALAAYLQQATTLTVLDFQGCNIRHYGAAAMATALPTSLLDFNISHNELGADGLWRLTENFHSLQRLTTLNISHNSCLDDGCLQVAQQLRHSPHLRVLDLSANEIGDTGCRGLADGMTQNPALEFLLLQSNCITEVGAWYLAQAIQAQGTNKFNDNNKQSSSLKELNLSHNLIGNGGCTAFANALYKARAGISLEHLDLSDNRIGDEGVGTWVDVLDEIPTLRHLELSGNPDVSEARTKILDMLFQHRQRLVDASERSSSERLVMEDDAFQSIKGADVDTTTPLLGLTGGSTTVYNCMVQDLIQQLKHDTTKEQKDETTTKRRQHWGTVLGFPKEVFHPLWTLVTQQAHKEPTSR